MNPRQVLAVLLALALMAGLLGRAQASHDNFCYLVADAGGGPPGDDLLTQADFTDFDPATNETNIGTGTGTSTIESIAFQPGPAPGTPGPLYAADAGQLGTLNLSTGAFTATSSAFGTGDGSLGSITFGDVDGLAFDSATGSLFGAHRRGGAGNDDLLIRIDPATGAHVPDAFGAGVDYVVIGSFAVVGLADIDDLAIDPADGQLYAVANNGGTGDRLVRINSSTGAVTDVGDMGVADMEGLSFDDDGQFWGTTGSAAPIAERNRLYVIDKTTGAASSPRQLDNGSDYESLACHKTLAATPTPTPTNTPTPTPTDPPGPTPTPSGPPELPSTGFAPGRVSARPGGPARPAYRALAELWLEIPSLGVTVPIVGVPGEPGGWDVSGLWNQAGYLEGTAFPTWPGNTVLTGHVYLANGSPGPFVGLSELGWGDELLIHAFGLRYTYQVREALSVLPDDLSVLGHETYDWLTLITCQGYDEQLDAYRWRRVVRAVLVEIASP